jgi:hypothetical protein
MMMTRWRREAHVVVSLRGVQAAGYIGWTAFVVVCVHEILCVCVFLLDGDFGWYDVCFFALTQREIG